MSAIVAAVLTVQQLMARGKRQGNAVLIVQAEEVSKNMASIQMQFSASNVDKKDLFGELFHCRRALAEI